MNQTTTPKARSTSSLAETALAIAVTVTACLGSVIAVLPVI